MLIVGAFLFIPRAYLPDGASELVLWSLDIITLLASAAFAFLWRRTKKKNDAEREKNKEETIKELQELISREVDKTVQKQALDSNPFAVFDRLAQSLGNPNNLGPVITVDPELRNENP